MIDIWLYIWLYYRLSSLLLFMFTCYSIHYVLIVVIIILYCTISLILHTHWEFTDSPEFAYSGLYIFYFTVQIYGEDHPYCEEPKFLCLIILTLILFMLSSLSFDWFSIDWTQLYLISIIHRTMLSCVEFYVILQSLSCYYSRLYNLLRLL